MISIQGLSKSVHLPDGERLPLLVDLALELRPGELVAILGRSGCGKSTLLNLLGLLDRFDTGSYTIDGRDVSALSDTERSRLRGTTFGFVFQQFHLLDGRSAVGNVRAPLVHASIRSFLSRDRTAKGLLDAVGLSDRLLSTPSQLSGGEQQRVAIARALVRSPRIILADEPTGSLDTDSGAAVLAVLMSMVKTTGATLVLVTHDERVAAAADRRLHLRAGRLEAAA